MMARVGQQAVRMVRQATLATSFFLIVAGSQLGMLLLAAIYVREGRIESMTSPEALAGVVAIALALVVMRMPTGSGITPYRDPTRLWLMGFLVIACIGELLRPDVRANNLGTFISIGAYYLVGSAIGRESPYRTSPIPILPVLLGIYTIWYLGMLAFIMRGDLGFYGDLPGSELARLEFRQGFSATELPIYVGFQFPILVSAILTASSGLLRVWAAIIAVCAVALVVATASSAAMFALLLVLLVFFVMHRGIAWRAVTVSVVGASVLFVLINVEGAGLVESVRGKLTELVIGDGVRALIYGELIDDIVEQPMGIGKGRFVETNSFSWQGEGVYPHQNLLGIGAELGVPALILYIGFLISAAVRLARGTVGSRVAREGYVRILAATVLAILIYQQFRGLFQDTWVIRESYAWLGVGLGALAKASNGNSLLVHGRT